MTQELTLKTALAAEPQQVVDNRTNFLGLSRDDVTKKVELLGVKPYRAKQAWNWVYRNGIRNFHDMQNIDKATRQLLDDHFFLDCGKVARDEISEDGTRKWLFEYRGGKASSGHRVETVFIPEEDRGTLCISSQVGCTLACTFCHTGTQQLVRNLTASEIVDQVMGARDGLGQWQSASKNKDGTAESRNEPKGRLSPFKQPITNIVFMGMGEPLFNYDHVKAACEVMMDDQGLYMSRRKITISTSGVVPKIRQIADDLGVNLAISFHACNDELRNEIVPINRKYPIKELIESLHYYISKHQTRHVLIEYVMLQGVNDSDEDAHELARLMHGLPIKVNLIPFNPWPGSPYECSSNNRIHDFARILRSYKITSTIRRARGQDILAACGQLKSDTERGKREKVRL